MKTYHLFLVAGSALMLATACQSSSGSSGPDEFRIVKKAPLILPPDYSLRPPQAGQAQPFEVDAERAGVATAFGVDMGANASASERALVASAGANAVSPIIREQIDYEETKTIRKSTSMTDRILFWRSGSEDDESGTDSATGGQQVQIGEDDRDRLKLPGT